VTRLAGKVAFITGAGSGIGRACAELFAQQGAKVVLAGRRSEPLNAAAAHINSSGGEAIAVVCDVTDSAEINRALQSAEAKFGSLTTIVNNAGVMFRGTAEQTSEATWDTLIDINLKGTFLVSRAAMEFLRRAGGGSIINIGSVYGVIGSKQRVAYAASKGGVSMLTRAMAMDHAQENIRVNCICPSLVDTEMAKQVFANAPNPEEARRQRVSSIPMGRTGTPQEIAHLAAYLASDESAWVTGAAFPIDGGEAAG
jgi:NAD(P)-dependent dehydrogenase (short-subunit alcohol dehydrogenase family)